MWDVYVAGASDAIVEVLLPATAQEEERASAGPLHYSQHECVAQGANFGHVATVDECDQLSAAEPECGDHFMFSVSHPEWQCRCCTPSGAEGGPASGDWDVYRVTSTRPKSFSAPGPIPTLQPV